MASISQSAFHIKAYIKEEKRKGEKEEKRKSGKEEKWKRGKGQAGSP